MSVVTTADQNVFDISQTEERALQNSLLCAVLRLFLFRFLILLLVFETFLLIDRIAGFFDLKFLIINKRFDDITSKQNLFFYLRVLDTETGVFKVISSVFPESHMLNSARNKSMHRVGAERYISM